ncbi:MAG TPA: DUF4209 domain-containing protein [Dehalococcoidia bacterium]|nr:DUF4209 domain-containing protein [Dehalococcoidia bacterium]
MVERTTITAEQRAVADEAVCEFHETRARLEADPLVDDFQRAQAFHAIWRRVQEVGLAEDESLQPLWYEAILWDLQPRTPEPGERRGRRWQPKFELANGSKLPDFDDLRNRAGFYVHAATGVLNTTSPVHRARYADVLWEMEGGYQRALMAAQAYLASVPLLAETYSYRRHDAILRALQLALQLQQAELVAEGKQALLDALTEREESAPPFDGLELLPWILEIPDRFIDREELVKGRQYAEDAAAFLRGGGEAESFRARYAYQLAARFARRLRDAEGERRALVALGEAIEAQAAMADGRSHLAAAHFLREAFRHYADLGFTEQAERMKRRLEEEQDETLPEFKTFRTSVELDFDATDRLAVALRDLPPAQSLAFIATRPDWHPAKAHLEAQAATLAALHPLLSAIGRNRYSHDGRLVANATTDAARRDAQVFDLYHLWAQMRGVVLARLYGRMAEAQRWTADTITDFLASGVAFDAEKLPLVRTGLERFFARDYASALFVLVPQLEDILRRLRGKVGLPTTSVKASSGITMLVGLDDVLATPQLVDGLGAGAIAYLRFLLTDQQGLNLRNDIAHGLFPEAAAQEPLAVLVVDVLLHLQPLYLTPTKEAAEQQSSEQAAVLDLGVERQASIGIPTIRTNAVDAELPEAAWIREMTDRIVHDFHPLRVILFGSHARGEAGPDSDVDLLIVLPSADDRRGAAIEIRKALAGVRVPHDIIVTDPVDIAQRGDEPSSVLYSALREGRVLYDRSEAREGRLAYGHG